MGIELDLEELKDLAVEEGAVAAWIVPAHEVEFDERTIYKCRFGCPAYGRYLTCPPHTQPPAEFEKALRRYRWAALVQCDLADLNRVVVAMEKEAMRRGYYLALGMQGHRCYLCEKCVPPGEPCRDPINARPSMSGLGINVFETLRRAGIEERLAVYGEDFSSWGMILVD
ncbi:MAG: DUF2284 domain-containing protein [Actinomycetota bacterium]|nr:DUF2284 domain-containing protein [Actinomycetota bacterium]